MTLKISSPAFQHKEDIPRKYTCEGEDISVPLEWEGAPEETKSLALIVDDPDAPDPLAPQMTFTHWVLYNLSPNTTKLPEGASPDKLPDGAREGVNDFENTGYGGPCPPTGSHRYFHKLHALDITLDELENPSRDDFDKAIDGHIIAYAELIGMYQKET